MAPESVIVRIRASRDGYFRCGIAHRSNATDHPIERFTEEQLERLKRDPDLMVQLIDGELPKGEDQVQNERKTDEEPPASGDAKPSTAKPKAAKPAAAKGAAKGGKGAKPAAKKEQPTKQPETAPTGEGGSSEGGEGGAP